MDSRTTWHMTSHRDWFKTYKVMSEGSVFMSNDHALEIFGISTIKFKLFDDTIHTIQGVQHMKGLEEKICCLFDN